MTWEITAYAASLAVIIAIGGYSYFAWASRDLDRRYGKPRRPGPAE